MAWGWHKYMQLSVSRIPERHDHSQKDEVMRRKAKAEISQSTDSACPLPTVNCPHWLLLCSQHRCLLDSMWNNLSSAGFIWLCPGFFFNVIVANDVWGSKEFCFLGVQVMLTQGGLWAKPSSASRVAHESQSWASWTPRLPQLCISLRWQQDAKASDSLLLPADLDYVFTAQMSRLEFSDFQKNHTSPLLGRNGRDKAWVFRVWSWFFLFLPVFRQLLYALETPSVLI